MASYRTLTRKTCEHWDTCARFGVPEGIFCDLCGAIVLEHVVLEEYSDAGWVVLNHRDSIEGS